MGAWNFWCFLPWKPHAPKIIVWGGGSLVGWLWSGSANFYFYGRRDFSETPQPEPRLPVENVENSGKHFFSTFRGPPGYPSENPRILSHPKVSFPWVSQDIPNFSAPPFAWNTPPHWKIPGQFGLCSCFLPERSAEKTFPQRNCRNRKQEPLEPFHAQTVTEPCEFQLEPESPNSKNINLYKDTAITWSGYARDRLLRNFLEVLLPTKNTVRQGKKSS